MDIISFMQFVLGAVSAFAVSTLVYRIVAPAKKKVSVTDLIKDDVKGTSAFDRLNPDGTMIEKIDLFFAKKLKLDKKLEQTHLLLGQPDKPNPLDMLHFKLAAAVIFPVFLFVLFSHPMVILFVPIGFILPDIIYSAKIRARQDEILGNFPTMVDLVALIVEAGLDYITAFERIVALETKKTALEQEIDKMLGEVQFGYSRRDALIRFSQRVGLQEIRSFVGLMIQSDELGTSLVDLLRNFSTDLRFRRLNKAEQMAAKASTKMLIPLFLFIFPVVFILALGPIIVGLVKGGLFGS